MSFQDNKFSIILGAATAVVAGGLIFWGISSGKKYAAAKDDYDTAVSKITQLTNKGIFPNHENRQAKEKSVAEYRADIEELQKVFDPFRRTELQVVDPGEFTDSLLAARKELTAKFEAAGTEVPDDFFIGLEKYTAETVDRGNTGVLGFQLAAFSKLFELLAAAEPETLINFHRPVLEEERGLSFDAEGRAYRAHPIEISFTGRESSLRKFLESINNSEDFYYVVRTIRIRNERQTAPNAKDARFDLPAPAAGAAAGGVDKTFAGGGFALPDELPDEAPGDGAAVVVEEAPAVVAEPADRGEILKQVLGGENIQVFLRIDVLQFFEPAALPRD